MERSNDTFGNPGNPDNHSGMADQPLICSHPCMISYCKHHPIAAPTDGTLCIYVDLFTMEGWKGCVRKCGENVRP